MKRKKYYINLQGERDKLEIKAFGLGKDIEKSAAKKIHFFLQNNIASSVYWELSRLITGYGARNKPKSVTVKQAKAVAQNIIDRFEGQSSDNLILKGVMLGLSPKVKDLMLEQIYDELKYQFENAGL